MKTPVRHRLCPRGVDTVSEGGAEAALQLMAGGFGQRQVPLRLVAYFGGIEVAALGQDYDLAFLGEAAAVQRVAGKK